MPENFIMFVLMQQRLCCVLFEQRWRYDQFIDLML